MESSSATATPSALHLENRWQQVSRLKLKLKEYHEKYPRIRKSLIFSKSPTFREYESLLLQASPLCTPDQIYLKENMKEGSYHGQFRISSGYKTKQGPKAAFKIKSSSSRVHYAVSPHRGFVCPGEEVIIIVQVQPKTKLQDDGNQNELFKNAVLGIFTADVDRRLEKLTVGDFWDYCEDKCPHLVGAHFIKKFVIVDNPEDMGFGTDGSIHTMSKDIPSSLILPPEEKTNEYVNEKPPRSGSKRIRTNPSSRVEVPNTKGLKYRNGKADSKQLVRSVSNGGFTEKRGPEDDENMRYLQLYNCMLLEKLLSQSKATEYTLIFLLIFLFLLILVVFILLRGFSFI